MMTRLILLDRNAVDAIKRCNEVNFVDGRRRQQLKKLDKSRNIISPILSIIEGQSGQKEDEKAIKATLSKEASAIGAFFQRANTDSNYLLSPENSHQFSEVFGNNIEHSWDNYIAYVRDVGPLLYQPVSAQKKLAVEDKLFTLARIHKVPLSHPIFTVSLALLYGHKGSRKVLKPKAKYKSIAEERRAAYNAVSDLIVISRIGMIKSAIPDTERQFSNIQFFTFDKGLLSVINSISITGARKLLEGGVSVTTDYSRSMFPEMCDMSYKRLKARLKGPA